MPRAEMGWLALKGYVRFAVYAMRARKKFGELKVNNSHRVGMLPFLNNGVPFGSPDAGQYMR